MKLWIDNKIPAPEGYVWCKDVKQAIANIAMVEGFNLDGLERTVEVIDVGDNCIELVSWITETGRNYPIYCHREL